MRDRYATNGFTIDYDNKTIGKNFHNKIIVKGAAHNKKAAPEVEAAL